MTCLQFKLIKLFSRMSKYLANFLAQNYSKVTFDAIWFCNPFCNQICKFCCGIITRIFFSSQKITKYKAFRNIPTSSNRAKCQQNKKVHKVWNKRGFMWCCLTCNVCLGAFKLFNRGTGNNVDWEGIPVFHNTVGKEVLTGISVEFFSSEFPSMISGWLGCVHLEECTFVDFVVII